MKRIWIAAGVLAVVVIVSPLLAPVFAPWSEISCEHQDINIKTGQARYSYKVWYLTVSERVEGTPLSLALQGERVDVGDIAAWHRANTFSPGRRYSPHYYFHGALHQAKGLEIIEGLLELTPDQKKATAKRVLASWQQSGNDDGVDKLYESMMEEGFEKQGIP